jgi:MFS family permease
MRRLVFIICSAALAAIAAWYGQPYVHHNSDFVVIVVTVFTVFAGFLIAIITILGDPSMIPDGSWRIAEARRDNIEKRLLTHSYLFILYLITIGFLFAGVLIQGAFTEHDSIRVWIERVYLFLGVFSFILSFGLPISLMKLQRARVDAEIERRRQLEGVGTEVPPAASGG